jgi:GNAT superfamily N-acetyltransferase
VSDRTAASPVIREGRDTDAKSIIALIGACWSQYSGVRMDVDGEMPELRALASYYAARGGTLRIAEVDGEVVGMIAVRPHEANSWEICRVYVHPSRHGGGLGHHLLDLAEAHARNAGADRLVLWSDTRFERAHHFYEKRSYVRSGPLRVLDDISHSLEFAYAKPVNGVAMLDAAAAQSAVPRLCDILSACVAEGADVSFLPPLAMDVARGFWRGIAKDVAGGVCILLGGWVDGVMCGAVTLAFASAENQPHRADVENLLVHPCGRRSGLARAMMQRLEQEALRSGRTLLTLDTRAGDAAERLCRSMQWNEAGLIPGDTLRPDRTPADTLFFWKALARR